MGDRSMDSTIFWAPVEIQESAPVLRANLVSEYIWNRWTTANNVRQIGRNSLEDSRVTPRMFSNRSNSMYSAWVLEQTILNHFCASVSASISSVFKISFPEHHWTDLPSIAYLNCAFKGVFLELQLFLKLQLFAKSYLPHSRFSKMAPFDSRRWALLFCLLNLPMEEFCNAIVDAAVAHVAENPRAPLVCFHSSCTSKAVVVRSETELFDELGEALLVQPDFEAYSAHVSRYYCENHKNLADLDDLRCRNIRKVLVSTAWLQLCKPEFVSEHVAIAEAHLNNFQKVLSAMRIWG